MLTLSVRSAIAGVLMMSTSSLVSLVVNGQEIEFSYDPKSEFGPKNWKNIVTPNNQCAGKFNSPVAIPLIKKCDLKADYYLTVSITSYQLFHVHMITYSQHIVQNVVYNMATDFFLIMNYSFSTMFFRFHSLPYCVVLVP
jgi:carbonic anhydrase